MVQGRRDGATAARADGVGSAKSRLSLRRRLSPLLDLVGTTRGAMIDAKDPPGGIRRGKKSRPSPRNVDGRTTCRECDFQRRVKKGWKDSRRNWSSRDEENTGSAERRRGMGCWIRTTNENLLSSPTRRKLSCSGDPSRRLEWEVQIRCKRSRWMSSRRSTSWPGQREEEGRWREFLPFLLLHAVLQPSRPPKIPSSCSTPPRLSLQVFHSPPQPPPPPSFVLQC